jgi:hypothetical protein
MTLTAEERRERNSEAPCNLFMSFVDADPSVLDRIASYGGESHEHR